MADTNVIPQNSEDKDSNSDAVTQDRKVEMSSQQSQHQEVESLTCHVDDKTDNSVKPVEMEDEDLLSAENLSKMNNDSVENDRVANQVTIDRAEMPSAIEQTSQSVNNDNLLTNANAEPVAESVLGGNSSEALPSEDCGMSSNAEHNKPSSTDDDEVVLMKELVNVRQNDNYNDFVEYKNMKNTNLTNEMNNSDNKEEGVYYIDKQNSLAALALQYDSSDSEDEDSENQSNNITDVNYRNNEIELSSDDSSDSESDSSSSDSDTDSSSAKKKSGKSEDSDSDGEAGPSQSSNNKEQTKKVFKPKGEFDDLPPIEDLKISVPEVLCDPFGEIAWTVEQMVVVRPKPGKPTLNLDTVLFIERGKRALGHIFDVFGQVAEPHYCVRFNSSEHIKECDIKVGMTVYYCPNTQYTSLVFLSELTKMKPCDDVGEDETPEFSDDEEEQAYLASLRNKPSNKPKEASNETPNKRRRNNKSGWQSNHPWNSNRDNNQQQNPKPFYRTHHPWQRARHPQHQNQWNNPYGQNRWAPPAPMGVYNNYFTPPPMQQMEVPRFPPVQWGPQYQFPQMNPVPGFAQALVPPFTLPPPPPPPPPPSSNADT